MERKEIERSLLDWNKGKPFISKRKLKPWYGKGDAKLEAFVSKLDYRMDGNRKEYFIGDIAKAILDERVKV